MRDYIPADFENMNFSPHKKFWQVVADKANELKAQWEKANAQVVVDGAADEQPSEGDRT